MSYEWTESALAVKRQRSESAARAQQTDTGPALVRGCAALFAQQSPEGFWCGELTADSTLESDYILLQLWLHQPEGATWNPPSRGRIERAACSILERQLPDGGFNTFIGGPSDVSATVKAYCALKLSGIAPQAE